MNNKNIVFTFFDEGYNKHNYGVIKDIVSESYVDHSPANARSNSEAIEMLKIVERKYLNLKVTIIDLIEENNLVATRVRYEAKCEINGERSENKIIDIEFEALENFRIEEGKIVESWGDWPDKEIETKIYSGTGVQ